MFNFSDDCILDLCTAQLLASLPVSMYFIFFANISTKNVSFDLFFMAHLILMWSSAAAIWILNDDWLRHDIIHRSVVDESEKNRNKKCHCSVFQYCSYLKKKIGWIIKKMVFCYQNCSDLLTYCSIDREKLLRSVEQFIQSVKGQNIFW